MNLKGKAPLIIVPVLHACARGSTVHEYTLTLCMYVDQSMTYTSSFACAAPDDLLQKLPAK